MARIEHEHIAMKPKWLFALGSLAMGIGVAGSAIVAVFLVSLISFSLRTHGPMGDIRFQQLISNFPWWAPIVSFAGILIGIWLLRKYDFSYKRGFVTIALIFIFGIIASGFLIDYLGLEALWSRRGPMQRFYERYDGSGQSWQEPWHGGGRRRIFVVQ